MGNTHPFQFLVIAIPSAVFVHFYFGRVEEGETTSGEGETTSTTDEQIVHAESAVKKSGGKKVRTIEKKDGFDMTWQEESGEYGALSVRREAKEDQKPSK